MIKWLSDSRRSIQIAGVLIASGLLVEVATLFWTHPISFMGFIFLGGTLVGLGVVIYLWTIVSTAQNATD